MLAGDILPAVKDEDRRSEIFDRICSLEHVILSIYMCIENTKWLEPAVRILKEPLPATDKGSIPQQFRALHNGQANMKVQISEFTFEDRTSSSGDAFWLSYRRIFLFSLRHFLAMNGQAPRKDAAKQSSPHPIIQQRWWHELSSLASESGYSGLRWKYSDRRAADAKAIEGCVRSILPSKYYQIDTERIIVGGCVALLFVVHTLTQLSWLLKPCHSLLRKYLLYPLLLRRHRLLGPWTRAEAAFELIYLAANIICTCFKVSSASDVAARAGNLSLVNLVPAYFGFHLSFVCTILDLSLPTYRRFHASTGTMSAILGVIHTVINVAGKSSLGIKGPEQAFRLLVGCSVPNELDSN